MNISINDKVTSSEDNIVNHLLKKIETKEAVVGVIGLGYVGLPLAVEKAKAGYSVIGFDIQQKRVDLVNKGINYIGDVVNEELSDLTEKKIIQATTDYSMIKKLDAISICVPTPLDEYRQPDVSYVQSSAQDIAKFLHKGMLVVLESTTYPGTTEEVVKPILESTGLKCGRDFFLAFSPERVDPGNKKYNTKNTPKVVGGVTKNCTDVAATLYRNILKGEVHTVSSPKVAEMEKILENTFRNINIALANEMAILCNKMGIDIWEVIDAASTKPYGFMPFYPGPGLGGHCIPVDPFYLTWKARQYGYHTRLIETAGEINNYMPEFVVERITKLLNGVKKPLYGSNILLLGVSYKSDIDDIRESPALKIVDILNKENAYIKYHDPFVPEFERKGLIYKSVELDDDVVNKADIVVVLTAHTNLDYRRIAENASLIFDTRNAFPPDFDYKDKLYKL